MNKTYCDWCGAYIREYYSGSSIVRMSFSPTIEICKNCKEKLKTFMKQMKGGK